jgi:hypothetical protein
MRPLSFDTEYRMGRNYQPSCGASNAVLAAAG